MKIGVLINFKENTDILSELEKAARLGIFSCQLCFVDVMLYTDKNAELINEASLKTGVKISALWAGWEGPTEWNFEFGPQTLGLVPVAYRDGRIRQIKKASDFATKIKVVDIITHVGFLPENMCDPLFPDIVAALRDLVRYIKNNGQYFLFETGQETPVTLVRTIEAIGLDNLGVNFDTANLVMYGKANSVDALSILGKYVRNTHIKDAVYPVCGRFLGKEKPVGQGVVDFESIIKKLKELNYQGAYTIEREISGEKQIDDIISAKRILEKLNI